MEDENRKHFRGIRVLVTLALLAACLSFAFTYILFKDISIPLNRMRTQELKAIQTKVDYLLSMRLNGRMDVELQMALQNMQELKNSGPAEVQEQAQKALVETQALLNLLRQAKAAQ